MMLRARDVYDVLGLPIGLRLHLARTVGVVRLVAASGDRAARALGHEVELAMALHDVGNAVKLPDDETAAVAMLQEPPEDLGRWRLYVSYTQARYGRDDHAATSTMLRELGVRPALIELIARKASRNLHSILSRGSADLLLALYADMRVAPGGVVSLEDRHLEATARYAGRPRQGLGRTVALADLIALESATRARFGGDPGAIAPDDIEALVDDCMMLDVGPAFGSHEQARA